MNRPLLAVAHGSRDPAAAAATAALLAAVADRLPGTEVRGCALDFTEPDLPAALAGLVADGHREAAVVPLLLTQGYHSRVDIPRALRAEPRLRVAVADVLGPDPLLVDALDHRLALAGIPPRAPVALVAAGSSDPRAQADVATMAALLAQRRGAPVRAGYATAARPDPAAALAALGPDAVVGLYFLAPGRLPDKVLAAAGGAAHSDPLVDEPALVELVLTRYRQAGARLAAG